MVKQQARFHLVMLLGRYNNSLADTFANNFHHRERERSSDKSEITEINDFWYDRMRGRDPLAAKSIRDLPTGNIDDWLHGFERIIDRILDSEGDVCRRSA